MLNKWENEVMFPILNHTISALEEQLQCHIEQVIQNVCMDIEMLFNKVAEQQEQKQKIAYITFHLMRKDILDGIYQYRLYVYDKSWYLKKIGRAHV